MNQSGAGAAWPPPTEEVWQAVQVDRALLADHLDRLTPDAWAEPTGCPGWTVRDVAVHLLVMAEVTKGSAMWDYMVASRLDLHRSNRRLIERVGRGRTDIEIARAIRTDATSRNTPPGLRAPGVHGELVVHALDIAEVTSPITFPSEHLVAALVYLHRRVKGNTRFTLTRRGRKPVLRCNELAAGLHVLATDVDWAAGLSTDPVAEGPADAVILALTGRDAGAARLTGPGAALLHGRLTSDR